MGKESILSDFWNALVDATDTVRVCRAMKACGPGCNAEVLAALELAGGRMDTGQALVADRDYEESELVEGARALGNPAYLRAKSHGLQLDWQTMHLPSYHLSMKVPFRAEQPFA